MLRHQKTHQKTLSVAAPDVIESGECNAGALGNCILTCFGKISKCDGQCDEIGISAKVVILLRMRTAKIALF